MISPLHNAVLKTIRKTGMLTPGERVGVAVSGGADSVALLRLLDDLRGQLGISLCVLHLNHQLRGAESDADEAFVEALARERGLRCHTARRDAAAEARRHGWNLEDAGRRLRYEFFLRIAGEGGATRIATAHTADDQAETVLARIIRGSGLKGLGAIQPRMGSIVRPLLGVRRQELREYLAERGQSWREDSSNQDLRQLRARLRHQLLPKLEADFSPSVVERLCSLSDLARDEEAFWSAFIEGQFEKLAEKTSMGWSILASELLSPAPFPSLRDSAPGDPAAAVTRRLIHCIHARVSQKEGQLSRRDVERVVELAAKGQSGRRIELPGDVSARREFDRIAFQREDRRPSTHAEERTSAAPASYEYEVKLPSAGSVTISIPELGRSLHLKLIDWPAGERDTRYGKDILDAERLSIPLVIRNWRPGDAYRPRGRHEASKLKRMFLASRIAATERALWPVMTSAGKVAWAQQMPVAAEFSANEATRIGLQISEDV